MGKWQDEYEREWATFARETLRAQFGRGFARHRVTADDKRELRELLRAMGSSFEPLDARHEPAKLPLRPQPTYRRAGPATRRSSVVRFQTPVRGDRAAASGTVPRRATPPRRGDHDDQGDDDEAMFPATQVLAYTQYDGESEESGTSDGSTSDTSMQSDVSYVYQTPQPKARTLRRVRQRSPAAAVSSVERQLKRRLSTSTARSSTSTFPAFTPRDLNASRLSASQTLRRQLGSMSPIAAARLRFSVDSALDESRTTFGERDESSVLYTMETETCTAVPAGGMHTPQPVALPARREAPVSDPGPVVDLDVSMQSMHLEEEEDQDDEMVGESGNPREVDQDEYDNRRVTAALDFKGMSDDDDDDEETVKPTKVIQQQPPPLPQQRLATGRWHWSETTLQGDSESADASGDVAEAEAEPALAEAAPVPGPMATSVIHDVDAMEQEVIEIDDDLIPEPEAEDEDDTRFEEDDMCAETEAVTDMHPEREVPQAAVDHGNTMSNMLKNRLRKAGLDMSDEENGDGSGMGKELNPFDSSTASAAKGSPTASSSSSSPTSEPQARSLQTRKRPSDARKLYYRTKLPLTVESTNTHVEERRRDRRQKLKKKLASIPYVYRVPECNVELAPYQREAVEWMMNREEPHVVAENNGRDATSARQREMYYDRLTAKMRGGILADEMGLGKTVCCIALICESLKKVRGEQSSESASSAGVSNSEGLPRLKAPTLIITPLSILSQWEKEIREKTNLSVISYQGSSRRQIQNVMDFMGVDVVLSTYDTLRLKECKVAKGTRRQENSDSDQEEESEDAEKIFDQLNNSRQWHTAARRLSNSKKPTAGSKLHQLMWHRVILDESHLITNPSCARAKAALILKSKRRWCVTGTPIQNSGKDLSSLMTFLGMSHIAADLDYHEVLSRVMLRRLKSTVDIESNEPIVQLPEKVEETLELVFATDLEKAYYTLLHRSTKRRVFEYLRKQGHGTAGQFMHVFELLLRLRQCCDSCSLVSDDPRQEVQDGNGALLAEIGTLSRQEAALLERATSAESRTNAEIAAGFSTKIAALLLELRDMKRNGEQGLVISQWTSFLDVIGEAIHEENARNRDGTTLRFCRLDGRMSAREREQAIASFQIEKRVDIILVSIRTGGLGLNLTAASQVFIMEPSWNPSIESQAIDRAHRVGQKRRVRIVRFLMKNTIEERVVELQRKKRALAKTTLGDGVPSSQAGAASTAPAKETALTRDELRELFSQELDSGHDVGDPDSSIEGAIWNDME